MPPNKSANNKGNITIYIDRKTIASFREACEFYGTTMSTDITSYMEKQIREYIRQKKSMQVETANATKNNQ